MPRWDLDGRVMALQVRLDQADEGGKYRFLSSAASGGPGPVMVASPALPPSLRDRGRGALIAQTVRLTEGWFAAWVAADCTDVLTLDVAGVGHWPLALPVLRGLRARQVLLAWDADWQHNPHVRRALTAAATELRHAGYVVQVETWPSEAGKGIDEFLVGQLAGSAP